MVPSNFKIRQQLMIVLFLGFLLMFMPSHLMAGNGSNANIPSGGSWWNVIPENENSSPFYDSILYSEVAPKLREIEKNSNRSKSM
jgi:hypothetical protein